MREGEYDGVRDSYGKRTDVRGNSGQVAEEGAEKASGNIKGKDWFEVQYNNTIQYSFNEHCILENK